MDVDFGGVVHALPALVWTTDPDGSAQFLNERWLAYTGLELQQARGAGWQQAVHPDDLPALVGHCAGGVPAAGLVEIEARLRRFDGEFRWFLCRLGCAREAPGPTGGWCAMAIDIDGPKRDTEALRESERLFRSIVDGLPAMVTLMTPEGGLAHANRHMEEYFGRTTEELKLVETTLSFHPDERPEVDARWKESIETGRPYDFEARLRRADGEYRWFHTRGFPLRDQEGRIVLWHLLQNDVDDRKRAEALLAGEKRFLEKVAEGQSISVLLEALCELVERTVAGCSCSVVLVDASRSRIEYGAAPSLPAGFMESLLGRPIAAGGGPCMAACSENTQVIAPDLALESRWSARAWHAIALQSGLRACLATPITSTAGKVLGAFTLFYKTPGVPPAKHQALVEQLKHVTSIAVERARMDAALLRSEAFLARAQHLSSTGSFSWVPLEDEITCSEELHRILGLEPAASVTLDLIRGVLHPEDLHRLRELIEQARAGVGELESAFRLQMRDGCVKYVEMVAHAGRDPAGRVEYIGAIQDVTQRRVAHQALVTARSELAHVARVTALGGLTASVTHEVSQPLSGIITNASTCLRMLAADPPNVAGARETARRTLRDGNRASDVITRLRALFAKKETFVEAMDLNEAAREVIALSQTEIQRSRVTLRAELSDLAPRIVGDRVQLQQVILNLLLNALDAMNEVHGRPRLLVIRTEAKDAAPALLSVRDTGKGFPAQDAERLFEPFYTTKSGGMGMGLSVSRSILESHGGRIWAAANADGPGSTFAFSIPPEASSALRP